MLAGKHTSSFRDSDPTGLQTQVNLRQASETRELLHQFTGTNLSVSAVSGMSCYLGAQATNSETDKVLSIVPIPANRRTPQLRAQTCMEGYVEREEVQNRRMLDLT